MDYHPIQGGVEILPVASCYRNQDKLRPDGPLGLYAKTLLSPTVSDWLSSLIDEYLKDFVQKGCMSPPKQYTSMPFCTKSSTWFGFGFTILNPL